MYYSVIHTPQITLIGHWTTTVIAEGWVVYFFAKRCIYNNRIIFMISYSYVGCPKSFWPHT